jgi:cytidylate kinase
MKRIIFGIVGDPGSGKTQLAQYLAEHHGFYYFEGSSGIKEAAKREGKSLASRKEFSDFHTRLQKKHGKNILARTLLDRPEDRLVFAGIRSVDNARALQAAGGIIIALNCPLDICFKRVDHTGLKYENTFDDFLRTAESERHSPDGFGANVQPVLALANITLDTSRPLEETFQAIDHLVTEI